MAMKWSTKLFLLLSTGTLAIWVLDHYYNADKLGLLPLLVLGNLPVIVLCDHKKRETDARQVRRLSAKILKSTVLYSLALATGAAGLGLSALAEVISRVSLDGVGGHRRLRDSMSSYCRT